MAVIFLIYVIIASGLYQLHRNLEEMLLAKSPARQNK